MNLLKRIGKLVACLALAFALTGTMMPGLFDFSFADTGDTPPHTKNVTDNKDGTYTISLDIVGDSEKQPNNVNVIVIFDRSGSMNNTRMNAAKTAVNNLARSLFAYNTTDAPNTVQMALVDFATTATSRTPTNSYDTFRTQVNNLSAGGGTNWEAALDEAGNVNFGDDDQTFVIFVSDGNPTFRNTRITTDYLPRNDNPNWSNSDWNTYRGDNYYYNSQGVYGLGSDNPSYDNYSPTSMSRCYQAALPEAQAIVQDVGADHFFTIGAYGDVSRMQTLTTEAGAPASNFYNANDTAALNQALADILAKIEMMGIGDAEIDDGTTNQVITSSGKVTLLELVPNFKYYRSGGDHGTMEQWTDAPEATIVDGEVIWDLSSVGVLENGVRYTVTFDCYPSQTTYDIIAQLKNGDIEYDSLDSEIKKYLVDNGGGSYSLRTNTNAGIKWDDTRDDEGRQTSSYVNPDPVKTDAETLTATKEWEGGDPDVNELEMTVLMDGEPFTSDTMSLAHGWSIESFISIGIIKNGQVLSGAEGHDFKFAELGDEQFHWELDTPTVHPMLIDGTKTMLVMVDDKHPAPSGVDTYTINGKTYYADTEAAGLTAVNHRRSNLNLTKVVTGEDAPAGATFPFTLQVNNPKAPETEPTNDPKHESDYWLWFSIYDTKAGAAVMDATVSGTGLVGPDADGYYYLPSKNPITVQMKDGWNLRFLNLPSGTTYTFTEGTLPEGFAFNKSELTEGEDSTFSGAQTTTGKIEKTKTSYTVKYTNDYALTDLEITKVWEDADNQDGLRPATLDAFAELLTLSPAVEGAAPEVTKKDDNTYTIKYTGLPRFNNGTEVEYTVTESAITGYTTTGSPAKDHGEITNSHTPAETEIDVEKIWKGPEGDAVTVTLYADNKATDKTLTLNAGNGWKGTFENLPVNDAGTPIEYSVVEDGVTGVDTSKYTTSITGNAEKGFTITNTNTEKTSITVDKIWDDASDQDRVRPETLTLTLTPAVEGATPAITQSEDGNTWTYTWTGLPKYKDNGDLIEYEVSEETVPDGYDCTGSPAADKGEITNSYTPAETEIDVEKIWKGPEGDAVTVTLYADNKATDKTLTLNAGNGWKGTFENLPVNDAGTPIEYSVVEDGVTGVDTSKYTTSITGNAEKGFTITNTNTEKTSITVDKIWDDASDQDRVRPETLTLTLTPAVEGATPAITQSEDGNTWTYTWTGLPKYKDNGDLIEYEVSEETVPDGYDCTGSPAADKGEITNSYTPAETEATVKKVWNDADNQDGKRPESLTVTLSDGKTATLNEENGWEATITKLPKYKDGEEIEYTWTEAGLPDGYELSGTSTSGTVTTLTNKHEPEKVDVSVKKVWDDADNKDKLRPASLTVKLSNGDSVTLNEGNNWSATIEGLPKYKGGQEISYTWEETDLPACYELVSNKAEGYVTTITNRKLDPVSVQFSGTKTLKGRTLKANEFEFILKDQDGKEIGRTSNAANGSFAFDKITYNDVGTYTYTIVEDNDKLPKGVQENSQSYNVTVEVTAGKGSLVATISGLNQDGSGANFLNVYQASPTKLTIAGLKVVKDKVDGTTVPLEGGEFTFTINGKGEVDPIEEETENSEATTKSKAEDVVEQPAEETKAEDAEADEAKAEADEAKADALAAQEVAEEKAEEAEEALKAAEEAEAQGADDAEETKEAAEEAKEAADKAEAEAEEAKEAADKAEEKAEAAKDSEQVEAPAKKAVESVAQVAAKAAKETITAPGSGMTAENEADGSVTFDQIEFTRAGTYTYEITEEGSMPGVTNEGGKKTVVVEVTDDEEGQLVAKITKPEGGSTPHFTFNNVYKTPPTPSSITDTIPVTKELAGHSLADGDFTFVLEDSNGKTVATAKNAADGTVTFPAITFVKKGTYTYKVREKASDSSVISSDTSVYTVKAIVTNNYDGKELQIEWVFEDGDQITFKNTWSDVVYIDPPVQKVIEGSAPKNAEIYTFKLEAQDPSNPMPKAANGQSSMTMSIKGAGTKEFGEIPYTEPGTYTYTVTEVPGSNPDCEYDGSVYTVTAVVTEDSNYKLHVKSTYKKDGQSIDTATFKFVNTYEEEEEGEGTNTGDRNNLLASMLLLTLSGMGICGTVLYRRRKEEN